MRPIELILIILTLATASLYLFRRVSFRLKYRLLPALLVTAFAVQAGMEGFRWQLWPVIVAILLLGLAAILRSDPPRKKGWLIASSVVGILLALISLAGGWMLPVTKPFPTTGPYQVGTTIFPLSDEGRMELYGDTDGPREIMVQVWYPASPTRKDQRALFMPDIRYSGPALAEWIEIPSFALNHLRYAKAHAYLDAPALTGGERFPVLVFSHGWSGFREQNIYQVEELASHGYIVVGISHTYGAVLTVFPDGRQMARNDDALPDGVSEEEYDRASNLLVRQWAGDIGFVLDELEQREDSGWLLSGRVDLERVGVFGHSTGGGATAEFCSADPRCDAALMMDLWVEPVSEEIMESGLSQPFLLMHSAGWVDLSNPRPNFIQVGELIENSSGEVTEFRIEGTTHHDFSALPLLTPLASAIGLKGPIDGDTGLGLINYYSVAFFDQYLLGADEGLLDGEKSPFEEAQFSLRDK